ncbi:MAG: YybH family protein [Pyrinomonadaceae bacterium]
MRKIIFVCLIILASLNLSFAQSKADEKMKTEIRAVMDAQVVAWNAGSIDGFMKGYWNSPDLKFVSGANVTRGWQPTLDRYKKSYDSKAKMGTLTFSDLEITILSKDAAVVLGSWSLQREKDNPHGKFTLTFRKFRDGWKIIIDHTS